MLRQLFILLLLLAGLTALWGVAAALGKPAPRRPYTITAATKAEFDRLKKTPETDLVNPDRQGLTRKGDWFFLRLAGGRQRKLLSKPGSKFEGDIAEITYLGKLPYLQKYLLQVMQWESSIFLLVDQTNGRIDTLQGVPEPSPTVQRLAVTYEYLTDVGGVEVYTVGQGRLKKAFRMEQEKWWSYGLAWVDDRTFILKCLPIAEANRANSTAELNRLLKTTKKYFYLRITSR